MSKRVALIDGDIVAYRCGFAAEHHKYHAIIDGVRKTFDSKTELNKFIKENPEVDIEWESELIVEPLDHALSTVKHCLSNIKDAINADACYVFLSDKQNFRNEIATALKYKGNRDNTRRPIYHPDIVRYLTDVHHAIQMPNLEADDLLADELLNRTKAGEFAVLASIDKDLLQVPGKHFNFVKNVKKKVTPDEGRVFLYKQVLTGDSTDNVPGIDGVGEVKAAALLQELLPTHTELRAAVTAKWDEYLQSGIKPPAWLDKYEDGHLFYKHWNTGDEQKVPLPMFIDELYKLLKVGIPTGQDGDRI